MSPEVSRGGAALSKVDARVQSPFDLGSSLPSHFDVAYPILIVWGLSLVTSIAPTPEVDVVGLFPSSAS